MSTFNSASFTTASIYLQNLFKKEEHIINLCQNNPTLILNLQLILEAIANKKRLKEIAGYTKPVFSMYNITITAIATAIRHGILDVIRNLGKFPLIPNSIPTHFTGQGIVRYFNEFNTTIHMYGKAHTLYLKHCIHPYHQPAHCCSKCKGPSHIHHNCGAYQCTGCLAWGPGHTTPNHPTAKEAQETWERSEEWARTAENWSANPNKKMHEQQWRDTMKTWAGVSAIPNEEWMKPREVVDLTSPSPSPPSTPPPSPLSNCPNLISTFSSSSSNSSLLFA